jgi:hypothetical protein
MDQDNSFNFRFQIGNGRQSKRLLANLGRILIFHYLFFFNKNRNTGFSSAYKRFVLTAAIALKVSGSNNIVSILPISNIIY